MFDGVSACLIIAFDRGEIENGINAILYHKELIIFLDIPTDLEQTLQRKLKSMLARSFCIRNYRSCHCVWHERDIACKGGSSRLFKRGSCPGPSRQT